MQFGPGTVESTDIHKSIFKIKTEYIWLLDIKFHIYFIQTWFSLGSNEAVTSFLNLLLFISCEDKLIQNCYLVSRYS